MPLSPMMQQYVDTKELYPDALLFFRVGDFYELYFEDAVVASKELDIILTGRDCGLEKRIEMSGVPFHSVEPYIAKLVEKGYKVAICEQTASSDGKKGSLFKREVVRIVTPGTLIDSPLLQDEKNNYIASVYHDGTNVAVAWSDISTGEFNFEFIQAPVALALGEILTRISPSEIICNERMLIESVNLSIVKFGMVCPFTIFDELAFEVTNATELAMRQFKGEALNKIKKHSTVICSVGGLLAYIEKTQKQSLKHIVDAEAGAASDTMYIGLTARRALELTENTAENTKKGSLLWLIDKTSTKVGARKLRKIILEPSIDEKQINARLDAVEELLNDRTRDKLKEILENFVDIERVVGKISIGSIVPKVVLSFAYTLSNIKHLKQILSISNSLLLKKIESRLEDLPQIYEHIISAIRPDSPMHLRDGGVFKEGYNKELDECLNIHNTTHEIIRNLESAERIETGFKVLKIDFTRNFGYYIELPRSYSDKVPFRYIRRQTLKNAERYTTEELKSLEDKILSASDKSITLEQELYKSLLEFLAKYIEKFLHLSNALAELDILLSHATVAKTYKFTKPNIANNITALKIEEGKHPVVEKLLQGEPFVPNNTLLDSDNNRIMLITGPNMAGKSVYMRQTAVITVLAHIGSFVPAKVASVPITDRIFTRVGASDDLHTGRSTFMVEMSEMSDILCNMSDRSLILLDEIGRGTATYDGLSIAWAILEHLAVNSRAKILFSTHYHELTALEGMQGCIKNYKLSLKELGGSIVFLRKLLRGQANKSFGIEVASLSGLPKDILDRAREILNKLETTDTKRYEKITIGGSAQQIIQQDMFVTNKQTEIEKILLELDIDNTSPRLALEILSDLKEKVGK
ncbi:MAG: DNA mismatch repair protein MutS [Firmicutes bacterium]|nr:DNA mismatch repair protein MutS [Bacillota bacterium]